ncbi:unnamed protein product [Amoebophrya sp. A25]|nr:unnamed protein product [Amoebophrya sp. A25]|eukprot:GSA25T00024308001.1
MESERKMSFAEKAVVSCVKVGMALAVAGYAYQRLFLNRKRSDPPEDKNEDNQTSTKQDNSSGDDAASTRTSASSCSPSRSSSSSSSSSVYRKNSTPASGTSTALTLPLSGAATSSLPISGSLGDFSSSGGAAGGHYVDTSTSSSSSSSSYFPLLSSFSGSVVGGGDASSPTKTPSSVKSASRGGGAYGSQELSISESMRRSIAYGLGGRSNVVPPPGGGGGGGEVNGCSPSNRPMHQPSDGGKPDGLFFNLLGLYQDIRK